MRHKIIKSTIFFQALLSSYFQRITQQVVETLVLLCVCHLFGLYNPNQVADALKLPKARLYRTIGSLSLYHAKSLNLRLGCAMAVDFIKDAESKSASTQSRRRITVSVDDTNLPRDAETLSYCSNYYSRKHNTPIWCQNVLGITLKVGDSVVPLDMRLVSKQGRGNTDKPTLVMTMIKEVLDCFDAHGIDLRKYPITFDSWYGSRKLVDTLSELGFTSILVHGKNNYVMTIAETKAKLSAHKKNIELHEDEWGCDKPVYRVKAMSPTFGECIVIFFRDRGKIRTLLVFGKPLRTAEAMRIWSQHHGIEQFWRHLKTNLHVSAMSLQSREGAYVSLGIKVISYLMLLQISLSERRTFHQIQLQLTGERQILTDFITHFHTIIPKEP
ncbi:transposase [Candidatus Poribacteria bacterium]|nr:transposase [Candidatus Poribacteria bacterium]